MTLALDLQLYEALADSVPKPAVTRSHVDEILARYDEVDAKLVAAKFPPTSPWWKRTITRWYRSGKPQMTNRCGRRAGKSSTWSRVAVTEGLYGKHEIPPGDVGMVAIVSTDRGEAGRRLHTIKAILKALGVPYRWNGAEKQLELRDRPIAFKVFTATVAGVSGFTAIFVFLDEVSKWKDKETGANPATDVIRSIRPTMATMPNARIVLSSSPMGMNDAHYDAFEEGETDLQTTAVATSWEANPTLTETQTRKLEPDFRTWQREYGAVPQADNDSSLISAFMVERATRAVPQLWHVPWRAGHTYVATMDPATRRNAWTLVIATKRPDGVRQVVFVMEWRGTPSRPLRPSRVLLEVQTILARYHLRYVWTDQASIDHLVDAAPKGLALVEMPWTTREHALAYKHLLKLAQDQRLELHPHPLVRADVLGILQVFTRGGEQFVLVEKDGRHSDFAPSVAMAVDDARFAGKPPAEELSDGERAAKAKVSFLEERRKRAEKERRQGRLPPTHRKPIAR